MKNYSCNEESSETFFEIERGFIVHSESYCSESFIEMGRIVSQLNSRCLGKLEFKAERAPLGVLNGEVFLDGRPFAKIEACLSRYEVGGRRICFPKLEREYEWIFVICQFPINHENVIIRTIAFNKKRLDDLGGESSVVYENKEGSGCLYLVGWDGKFE